MLVTVGVDTHTDVHVAAVLDPAGRLLETASFPAATRGYARLATWAESLPPADQGLRGPPHCRGQDQDRDHPLPQAVHRPRGLPPPAHGHARARSGGGWPDRLTQITAPGK